MNSVVEKLAAIEKEVEAIQPKMAPLTERIADLHQKVTNFNTQLADLAAESVAVKQDVELTRQSLSKIQSLISESKVESEQLVAGQEENLQRCETMTAVFGAAFQAVSQFFEAAQKMGLADQAKAVFLSSPSAPETLSLPPVSLPIPSVAEPPKQELPPEPPQVEPQATIAEPEPPAPVAEVEPPIAEPPVPEPIAEAVPPEPPIMEPPMPEPVKEIPLASELPPIAKPIPAEPVVEETPIEESIPEEIVDEPAMPESPPPEPPIIESPTMDVPVEEPPIVEPPSAMDVSVEEPPIAEPPPVVDVPVDEQPIAESPIVESPPAIAPATESILSAEDFDAAVADSGDKGLASWSAPGLPDVAAPPEMTQTDADAEPNADEEQSDAVASQLDVPPLNLASHVLPEQNESAETDASDADDIEAMLAAMSAPVTAVAGG